MRLTVLVDNNASKALSSEWGLSFLLEDQGRRFLLDTGASDLFLRNAEKLEIELEDLDAVILSHGHWDHSWGLNALMERPVGSGKKTPLIYHPLALIPKERKDGSVLGFNTSPERLESSFELRPSSSPVWLTDHLAYLGEIPRHYNFEAQSSLGKTLNSSGKMTEDFIIDDTALAYKGQNGLIIITGCSHSGICNIVSYARKICGEQRIEAIIGGLHLLEETTEEQTTKTIATLRTYRPRQLYPCHCVNLSHKIALNAVAPVGEVKTGSSLEFK